MPPPISTKDLIRFTPDNWKDKDDAPVFLIKVPTVREKIGFEAQMELEGLRYPQNLELYTALREAIKDQVIDEEQPALLAIIDEAEAVSEEGGDAQPDADLLERVEEINKALRQFYRPLGQVHAERRRYLGMVWYLRAQMFLMGIEGKNPPAFERRGGVLTDKCIEAIEERYGIGTIVQIGIRTIPVMTPDEDERKNSELLEPSPADPEISTAAPSLPTARRGKSSAPPTLPILN